MHLSAAMQRNSFFNQRTAQELWKMSTSVSNQGRQRGRARGLAKSKNLNKGQKLGFGKARISWPGLNKPALDRERNKQGISKMTKEDFTKYEDGVAEIRSNMSGRGRKRRQTPLERGWTSASPKGKQFAHPTSLDPATDYSGFQSVLVQYQTVSHMTGSGKVRLINQMMLTGNGNGMAGFALSKSSTRTGGYAFQKAVNRAGLRLIDIDMFDNRTVFHDFYTQFGQTRLFVYQRPPGFGIKAHRVIKAACQVIGLKDLEVVKDGSDNKHYGHMVKAFFLGLMRQRTHQDLANEKGLHLVEVWPENGFRLLASPEATEVKSKEELNPNESLDFGLIGFEGQVPFEKKHKWELTMMKAATKDSNLERNQVYLKRNRHLFHHFEQTVQMMADYGRVESYWTGIYPECQWWEDVKDEEKKSNED